MFSHQTVMILSMNCHISHLVLLGRLIGVFNMQYRNVDSEFEENEEFQPKRNTKQSRKKWREIESFKERQKMKRELAYFDDYSFE